ncbi:MAG TPA: DNA polymerase III subunit delta [Bacillota bacterium]|nr:DNA polymerase III subunit delta [Bacillota bacterium]
MKPRRTAGGRPHREARRDISDRRLLSVYLFHGSEIRLQEDLLFQLRRVCLEPGWEAFNYLVLDGDAVDAREVAGYVETAPAAGGRRLVVVRDLSAFLTPRGSSEAAGDSSVTPPDLEGEGRWLNTIRRAGDAREPTGVLVFTLRQPADARRRLYKELLRRGAVVDCSGHPVADTGRWLQRKAAERGKELPEAVADAMIHLVGNDLNRLEGEIEKAIAYAGDEPRITQDHLAAVAVGGTAWGVFDLTAAISERSPRVALKIAHDLLAGGEVPVRLVALIGREVRLLLAVKFLGQKIADPRTIASELGLQDWLAQRYIRHANAFTLKELQQALAALVEADLAIKSGRRDGALAVELLVAGMTAGDA